MYILLLIVLFIIIGFVSIKKNEHKYRDWESAEGKIIEFVEEKGLHYPVFSYITKNGKTIISRNIPKNNEKYFKEASIEEIFPIGDDAKEFLRRDLPITEVLIKYNPEFPEQFIPKY